MKRLIVVVNFSDCRCNYPGSRRWHTYARTIIVSNNKIVKSATRLFYDKISLVPPFVLLYLPLATVSIATQRIGINAQICARSKETGKGKPSIEAEEVEKIRIPCENNTNEPPLEEGATGTVWPRGRGGREGMAVVARPGTREGDARKNKGETCIRFPTGDKRPEP
ncbi:hypothetical protein K0M31_014355 [Melipona bicolor]|uniref:Uncharacterized protein n=1 Tax=Melipona bicolor TaxID=60889 RepID=A0AA40KU30_9HYME|nr:hypothetical protein K0M31_014355 [Melipona bicolor]